MRAKFIVSLLQAIAMQQQQFIQYSHTPNANNFMADHSVGARDQQHEIEASQASMFCFDNASPEKPCFAVDLAC